MEVGHNLDMNHSSGAAWMEDGDLHITPQLTSYVLVDANNGTVIDPNDCGENVPNLATLNQGVDAVFRHVYSDCAVTNSNLEYGWSQEAGPGHPDGRPNAWFRADPTGDVDVGDTVEFDASESMAPTLQSIVNYTWVIDGEEVASGGDQAQVEHEFTEAGEYTVTLTIESRNLLGSNPTDSFSRPITVLEDNEPPNPSFSFAPEFPDPGEEATFDATATSDPNENGGTTVEDYQWEFGDDATAGRGPDPDDESYVTASHTYDSAGVYEVTLTAFDDYGASASTTQEIVVGDANQPGAGFAVSSDEVGVGEAVTVTPDTEYGIARDYEWRFGDGETTSGFGLPIEGSHSYDSPGTYQIVLEVTTGIIDPETVVGVEEVEVTWPSTPPVAEFSVDADDPEPGEELTFDATATTDPDSSITSYDWAFGDDSQATGETVTHTYDEVGYYQVELTVTDEEGVPDTTTQEVVVGSPGDPRAAFEVDPRPAEVGEAVTFEGPTALTTAFSDYEWEFGDGSTASGSGAPGDATHTYDATGTYTVRLSVEVDLPVAPEIEAVATRDLEVVESTGGGAATEIESGETVEDDLTSSESPDRYSYTGGSGDSSDAGASPSGLDITLDVPSGADFDLYVTTDGRRPSPSSYDYRSTTSSSTEVVTVDGEDLGDDVRIAVVAYSGGGTYELELDEE